MLIRFLAILGLFVFTCLWFLGADHGQYINPPHPKAAAAEPAKPQARAVFVPSLPVQQAQVQVQAPDLMPTDPPAPAMPGTLPVLTLATRVMHVPGGASVRSGPGREFPVLADLAAGAVVMVADDGATPGWVRIEVDGLGQGWVAAPLLRE